MGNSIFDLFTGQALATYWTEVNSNREPYLGEVLFPARKKLGLDLSWIKGYRGLPVALKPSNFDAKAEIRDRIGVKKIETEMPFFREAMLIKEKDRQELLKVQESAPAGYYEMLVREIYDDVGQLVNGALVQPERMRMQLLLGGKINIATATMAYEYDFDQSGKYLAENYTELLGTDKWSDHTNSKPISDIQKANEKVEDEHGTTLRAMVLTRATWTHLLLNNGFKMDMNVLQGQHIILTDAMLRQYLAGKLNGLRVIIYNKKYTDEAGVNRSFFPDGYVALIPDGNLGTTWYGTTPEEADLMGGTGARVGIVNTGVAITTYRDVHPVNVNTVVSEIVLPSFERMNETYLMKVA